MKGKTMELSLKNIGKIKSADIQINGITVIAGENNTGKSTVGKVLFCVFNSSCHFERQIKMERIKRINRMIHRAQMQMSDNTHFFFEDEDSTATKIVSENTRFIGNPSLLKEEILRFFRMQDEVIIDEKALIIDDLVNQINQIISISDQKIYMMVLQNRLEGEFAGQINNAFYREDGEISLIIKNEKLDVRVVGNKVVDTCNHFDLEKEAIYIDDPFALDDLSINNYFFSNPSVLHREELKHKLIRTVSNNSAVGVALDEIITSNKLDSIYRKINTVCSGEIVKTERSYVFNACKELPNVDIRNVSAGIKVFAIIKTLLENGSLEENGTVILDEPEVHLHPEWQLVFAEIIVLLNKEYGMHILLNTHSPYFLEAIEVYSKKHGVSQKCNYYLAENKGEVSTIREITDGTEEIYSKLAKPFQILEDERFENGED